MPETATQPDITTRPASLTVDAVGAAAVVGLSRSTWHSLVAAGKAPEGVKLGSCRRWLIRELDAWLAAGCPPAARWAGTWAAMSRRN